MRNNRCHWGIVTRDSNDFIGISGENNVGIPLDYDLVTKQWRSSSLSTILAIIILFDDKTNIIVSFVIYIYIFTRFEVIVYKR